MPTVNDSERARQPDHPGWRPLSAVLGSDDPLFAEILFLPGYVGSSNIYALAGDGLAIVDAGNDYTAFLDLFRLGHRASGIGKIVLTHGHRDHAMGVLDLLRSYPEIRENGGVELVLHEAAPAGLREIAGQGGARLTEVRGGETLRIGGRDWEVLHTPGHTADGICLYHRPSRTAFTGDTVLPHAMAEPDEHGGGRLDHYLFGVRVLLGRDPERLLPGHGMPVASAGRRVVEETYEGLMLKVLGIDPKGRIPWIAGAAALARKGCLEEAVYCCGRELAQDPGHREALRLRSVCLNDLGRFTEALESIGVLERLGPPGPGDPFPSVGKGYALMGLGRYAESLRCFEEALRVRPGMRDAQVYQGMALFLSGRPEEAMEIEPFRTEFAGRFREEMERSKTAPGGAEGPERRGGDPGRRGGGRDGE